MRLSTIMGISLALFGIDSLAYVTDTLPLIIFMTGTDTTQPFHIPSLTSHSSLAEEDWHMPIESFQYILLYYFVSIKSLLSTTLLEIIPL